VDDWFISRHGTFGQRFRDMWANRLLNYEDDETVEYEEIDILNDVEQDAPAADDDFESGIVPEDLIGKKIKVYFRNMKKHYTALVKHHLRDKIFAVIFLYDCVEDELDLSKEQWYLA
jgi:hypothetical protein